MTRPDQESAFLAFMRDELGAAPEHVVPGSSGRFSTNGRRGDTAGAWRMFPDGLGGLCTDFRQGITRIWIAIPRRQMTREQRISHERQIRLAQAERDLMEKQEWAANKDSIERCQKECVSISEGDPVMRYFQRRGLIGPMPHCLRLHHSLAYFDEHFEGNFPAMVAPLVTPDGRTVALHRTYLTGDGRKAPVKTVKKLTRVAGRLDGTCIPLRPPHGGLLGIAEGIETAQAVYLKFGVPTVAAYCAGNLGRFVWPAPVRKLAIFADCDEPGIKAADALAQRARSAGLLVETYMPPTPGEDWCDVWGRDINLGGQEVA